MARTLLGCESFYLPLIIVNGKVVIEMDKRDNTENGYTDENGIRFIDTKVVGDFYGVSKETVLHWIKDGKISGKQLSGHGGKWFVPAEEFEYLKKQRKNNTVEEDMRELLGDAYAGIWEIELDEG